MSALNLAMERGRDGGVDDSDGAAAPSTTTARLRKSGLRVDTHTNSRSPQSSPLNRERRLNLDGSASEYGTTLASSVGGGGGGVSVREGGGGGGKGKQRAGRRGRRSVKRGSASGSRSRSRNSLIEGSGSESSSGSGRCLPRRRRGSSDSYSPGDGEKKSVAPPSRRFLIPLIMAGLAIVIPNINIFPTGYVGGAPVNATTLPCLLSGDCGLVELPGGETFYSLSGPEDGEKVVLVHGLTVAASAGMSKLSAALARTNRRVLSYDLFGHGHSGSPDVPHTLGLFVTQLANLMLKVGFVGDAAAGTAPVLVGSDIGGAIATEFARLYPDRVKGLALMSPMGLRMTSPLIMRMAKVSSFFGDVFAKVTARRGVRHLNARSFVDTESEAATATQSALLDQVDGHRGYVRSMLSIFRHFPFFELQTSYEAVGAHPRPVLIVWGTLDRALPYYPMAEEMSRLFPHGGLVSLLNSGHNVFLERASDVATVLVSWLDDGNANCDMLSLCSA